MNIESKLIENKKSQKEIYDFLCDLNNFETLMPDSIEKFEVEGESFLFSLKGMPEIRLVLKEKTPHSQIVLGAASSKLPFTLTANIDVLNDGESKTQLVFEGQFNAMMAMMIKRPLKKFVETLSENIEKL